MTANELADAIEKGGKDGFFQDEIIAILRQQQAEIESLKKELALQRLSDIGQEIERELTDEEIMEIYDREELYNIDEGQMYLKPIEFAKELLKKASEK